MHAEVCGAEVLLNPRPAPNRGCGVVSPRFWLNWVLGSLLLSTPALGAPEGSVLYQTCAVCHGQNAEGNETLGSPALASREGWYLKRQIEQFRVRARGLDESKDKGFLPPETRTQAMHPVVDGLRQSEVRVLTRYLGGLPTPSIQPPKEGDPKSGESLYGACAVCHGVAAEGRRIRGAPRLTGQQPWYLFNQLRDFRMGWRGTVRNDPHVAWMREQLGLEDAALKDLVAYLVQLNSSKAAREPLKKTR